MDNTVNVSEKKSTSPCRKCLGLLLGVVLFSGFALYTLDQSVDVSSNDETTPTLDQIPGGMYQDESVPGKGSKAKMIQDPSFHPKQVISADSRHVAHEHVKKTSSSRANDSSSSKDTASSPPTDSESLHLRVAEVSPLLSTSKSAEPSPHVVGQPSPHIVEASSSPRVKQPLHLQVKEPLPPRAGDLLHTKATEPSFLGDADLFHSRDEKLSFLRDLESFIGSSSVADPTKLILVLAYQRVGSSFAGSMFDMNPNMLYIYEPLDGVYTHLYGTSQGWAVPIDIHFHWNRTHREMPAPEKEMVSHLIEQILTCDFDNMISEYLVSEFWHRFSHKAAHRYSDCVKRLGVGIDRCQAGIRSSCPSKVGKDLQRQAKCGQQLSAVYGESGSSSRVIEPQFKRYKQCMDNQRTRVMTNCISSIKSICQEKKIRVVKTVRLEADTIEELKQKHPGLKIIHMIRDPRAVVLSRIKVNWATLGSLDTSKAQAKLHRRNKRSTGAAKEGVQELVDDTVEFLQDFAGMEGTEDVGYESHFRKLLSMSPDLDNLLQVTPDTDFGKVGQLYCYLALRDKLVLQRFEETYPGTVYELVYENLVTRPITEMEKMYEFLDETIPDEVERWLKSHTKDSRNISQKWKKELDAVYIKDIDKYCYDLYDAMDFVWPT